MFLIKFNFLLNSLVYVTINLKLQRKL